MKKESHVLVLILLYFLISQTVSAVAFNKETKDFTYSTCKVQCTYQFQELVNSQEIKILDEGEVVQPLDLTTVERNEILCSSVEPHLLCFNCYIINLHLMRGNHPHIRDPTLRIS